MEALLSFINLIFVGFVSLFPPVNPIGTALVVDPLLAGLKPRARKVAALRIAFYCFGICAGAMLAGSWLFKLFGISIPVVQLAGGILICKMGWEFLSSDSGPKDNSPVPKGAKRDAEGVLFYPVSFPMTTGPGTISVLLTLSAHGSAKGLSPYFINLAALLASVALMCVVIYFSYGYTHGLLRALGGRGVQMVNRLSAFLVFCVGIQIAVEGITHLIQSSGV